MTNQLNEKTASLQDARHALTSLFAPKIIFHINFVDVKNILIFAPPKDK